MCVFLFGLLLANGYLGNMENNEYDVLVSILKRDIIPICIYFWYSYTGRTKKYEKIMKLTHFEIFSNSALILMQFLQYSSNIENFRNCIKMSAKSGKNSKWVSFMIFSYFLVRPPVRLSKIQKAVIFWKFGRVSAILCARTWCI